MLLGIRIWDYGAAQTPVVAPPDVELFGIMDLVATASARLDLTSNVQATLETTAPVAGVLDR